jgi:hypothetical protein
MIMRMFGAVGGAAAAGLCVGQRSDGIAHILTEVAGNLAHGCRRAHWLQRAGWGVALTFDSDRTVIRPYR